jgi:guanosine-3',5'-bis(diphosphate) 3'-pyrophosphohydrolase
MAENNVNIINIIDTVEEVIDQTPCKWYKCQVCDNYGYINIDDPLYKITEEKGFTCKTCLDRQEFNKIKGACLILKTVNFAALKHSTQRRKDIEETPYINHPIGVANSLCELAMIGVDIDILVSAILHDTVEDTNTSFEEIERVFGENVANIVREVTDDKSLPKHVRKLEQISHAKNASYQAKMVKLADKLYNCKDLQTSAPWGWTRERIQGYFVWAKKVVNVIRGTNQRLEDALDNIFNDKFLFNGELYPAIPKDVDEEELFQRYIVSLKN